MSRVPGSISSLEDMRGRTFTSVDSFSDRLGYKVRLYTPEFLYTITAPMTCCDTYTIDLVEGDLEDLLEVPLLSTTEFDGVILFSTIKGTVSFRWLSRKRGYDLYGVRVFKVRNNSGPT